MGAHEVACLNVSSSNMIIPSSSSDTKTSPPPPPHPPFAPLPSSSPSAARISLPFHYNNIPSSYNCSNNSPHHNIQSLGDLQLLISCTPHTPPPPVNPCLALPNLNAPRFNHLIQASSSNFINQAPASLTTFSELPPSHAQNAALLREIPTSFAADRALIDDPSSLQHANSLPNIKLIKQREDNMVAAAREFRIGATKEGEAMKKSSKLTASKSIIKSVINNNQLQYCGTGRSGQRNKIQRENHILAERQRREEMNDKFCILRSMISKSTKKDKASIVGDTIDYILELEKELTQLKSGSLKRNLAVNYHNSWDETLIKSKVSGQSTPNPYVLSSSEDKSESAEKINFVNRSASNSSNETLNNIKACEESTLSSSDPLKLTTPSLDVMGNISTDQIQVEVQNLGNQAVIKVLCAKSPGLVLRILAALDECRVDILQSNVTTLGDKVVQFITIEMKHGVSTSLEHMENALRVAAASSNARWHHDHHACTTQLKLEPTRDQKLCTSSSTQS